MNTSFSVPVAARAAPASSRSVEAAKMRGFLLLVFKVVIENVEEEVEGKSFKEYLKSLVALSTAIFPWARDTCALPTFSAASATAVASSQASPPNRIIPTTKSQKSAKVTPNCRAALSPPFALFPPSPSNVCPSILVIGRARSEKNSSAALFTLGTPKGWYPRRQHTLKRAFMLNLWLVRRWERDFRVTPIVWLIWQEFTTGCCGMGEKSDWVRSRGGAVVGSIDEGSGTPLLETSKAFGPNP
jgi:hypothetical protein